jgi:sialidase-1
VTTKKGTLLAVYDIRYNGAKDLQEHIDIGLSRSTDGGRTWQRMRRPISYGEAGGLPSAQNGAGDPAILIDRETGDAWIASIWAHGMGRGTAWWSTVPGLSPDYTAQLVLSRSTDDGRTWSAPVSVTPQLKDSAWAFFFEGPGRGITTSDGTLVFAMQYTDFDAGRTPHAGILYSRDHGRTWQRHAAAKDSVTEAQVAELSDGTLMLNMRDNRGGFRSVATTRDLGRTWTEHPSSRSALREPVCMASLIAVKADENVLGRHILLFSNPDTVDGRNHITIKASLDDGLTWKPVNQVLLDEDEGWGYSCLTMIDPETVGILYESSAAHITFQAVPLRDIVNE